MKQPQTSIGTIEEVSLPDYGVDGVLAKIDTGADSSAVWASNITEKSGQLSFTLFGPTSPYYSGEKIRSSKYSLVTVKNSFGQKELRYKVDMRMRIGGRVIKARITLANRSNHRFPILIGRRTLRGKFVVDVSKRPPSIGNQRVLMIVAGKSQTNRNYADALVAEGLDLDLISFEDLTFRFGFGEGSKISVSSTGEDVAGYGLVYFRTSYVYGHPSVSSSVAQYLFNRNVDYVDRIVNLNPSPDKLYQYTVFSDNRIPIPKTIFMLPDKMAQQYEMLVSDLGLPFILKDTRGRRGENNYLINTKAEFDRALRQSKDLDVWMLAQQYIPNDGDYRLLTIGGQVELIIKRRRKDGAKHVNNTSAGGYAELVEESELPPKLINLAVMTSRLLHLQITGVDLIQDKVSKLWYCLEVNKAPQIYSGSFISEKEAAVAKYLNQRLYNN